MSIRDWRVTSSIVEVAFAVVALVILGVTIWAMTWLYAHNSYEAQHYAAEYASQTQQKIEQSCTFTEIPALTKCISEIIKTTHEHERSEADLNAQRDMANWALGVLVVSGLTLLVTAIGVWYVRRTLHEAQDTTSAAIAASRSAEDTLAATQIANQIMREDQRPWVAIKKFRLASNLTIEDGNQRLHFKIQVILENTGRTPATNVWPHHTYVEVGRGVFDGGPELQRLKRDARKIHPSIGFTLFPGETRTHQFNITSPAITDDDGAPLRPKWPLVVGFIHYVSVYDRNPHMTGFNLSIPYVAGSSAVIPDEGSRFPASAFRLDHITSGQFTT